MITESGGPAIQSEIWDAASLPPSEASRSTAATLESGSVVAQRFKAIERRQTTWAAIDVEQLVPPDHLVRAIWEMTGQVDWSSYCAHFKAVEGKAGCSPFPPRLLASLWILAYSEGVNSPRVIEQRCKYDPAYRWLTGMQVVGYHTVSDFRVDHPRQLDELFARILAVLQSEGLISLERVTQDGTKVKAAASADTFHREKTLQQHLEEARERVKQLGQQRTEEADERSDRQRAAQERAARERWERLNRALEEMPKVAAASQQDPAQCRVSETEPEARNMKQPQAGGYAPSYNLQVVADAAQDLVVAVQVTQACNDQGQLEAGLDQVQRQTGVVPKQAVVDEGYVSRATVLEMDRREVELIGGGRLGEDKNATLNQKNWEKRGVTPEFYPNAFVYDAARDLYLCPGGQELLHRGVKHDREGVGRHEYRAGARHCRHCPHQFQCCPVKPGNRIRGRLLVRTQEVPVVAAYTEKMKTPEAQAIYRERKRIAEFPNLWLKEKLGLRRFRVRGLVKVTCEALWACLTYNIQQWARLRWRPQSIAAVAA